ncbi:MAG: hypothetical protein H7X79_08715 [Sporomusaceae bacterium]|nr:hypothetical protein [Sporomusaceae bacterium]
MTIKMDCDEKCVSFHIEGDIYDEHAECLCDMINSQVLRGIKDLEIQLRGTYYISRGGQRSFQRLKNKLGIQGVYLSFNRGTNH